MLPVLVTSENTRYWSQQAGLVPTLDHQSWLASQDRVSLIEITAFEPEQLRRTEHLLSQSTLCLLFFPELTSDQWCRRFDHDNVIMFVNGRLNWHPQKARLADCFYFFWSTCDFYQQFPELLNIANDTKTACFDALLGRRKSHRDQLHDAIDHDKNVVRYFSDDQDRDIRWRGHDEFEWPNGMINMPDHAVHYTVQEINVNGTIVSLSQILPVSIYARSCYSLVAETENQNSFSFFTEKIVKPILAKRLFVVASGQHYLSNLRSIGFHTFDSVIDESYDKEADAWRRNEMLLDQVRWLQQQNFAEISKTIQPILDHNFRIMTQIDWQQTMIDTIRYHVQAK